MYVRAGVALFSDNNIIEQSFDKLKITNNSLKDERKLVTLSLSKGLMNKEQKLKSATQRRLYRSTKVKDIKIYQVYFILQTNNYQPTT